MPFPSRSAATMIKALSYVRRPLTLLAGHVPHGPEPRHQRQMRVLEDRAGRDGHLVPAACTQPKVAPRRPSDFPAAARADETLGPPKGEQILPASLLGGEPLLQLHQRSRVVLAHGQQHYRLGLVESSQYPCCVMKKQELDTESSAFVRVRDDPNAQSKRAQPTTKNPVATQRGRCAPHESGLPWMRYRFGTVFGTHISNRKESFR